MNIYNLTLEKLEQYFINKGDKKYRAKQIYEWLYQKRVKPFDEMDNIKNEIIDKDEVILLYCKSGKRSRMAKEILLQEGYENVYTFDAKI